MSSEEIQVDAEQNVGNEYSDLKTEQGFTPAKQPLCPVHTKLEADQQLECEIGNGCVACSLHERTQLLKLLGPYAPNGAMLDSITVLQRLLGQCAALEQALRSAAPHVCSARCPSVKRTGTEWSHVEQCKAISAALALVNKPEKSQE